MDRLTNLIDRFRLRARPAPEHTANLAAFRDVEDPAETLVFTPNGTVSQEDRGELLFALKVDLDTESPLLSALPDELIESTAHNADLANIVALLESEFRAMRCGAPAVLARLGEVLVVRLLRARLDRGDASPGLFAGLADPRVSRALVAIHEDPQRNWRVEGLADVAGLSPSRFKEVFARKVGAPPSTYLRSWRMSLARQDLERGARLDRVARKYGYRAPEAFSRAFFRAFGVHPKRRGGDKRAPEA